MFSSQSRSSQFRQSFAATEVSGGQPVVGNGTTVPGTDFYSPSVVISPNAQYVSAFVNGSPAWNRTACGVQPLDQVFRYTHPYTWDGLTSQFWTLPNPNDPSNFQEILPNCADQTADYGYGNPFAFSDVGRYWLVVGKPTKAHTVERPYWTQFILGMSSLPDSADNVSWGFSSLLAVPTSSDGAGGYWNLDINLLSVTLRPVQIGSDVYWWGFLYYKLNPAADDGLESVTEIRFHLSTHSGNTAIPDYYEVMTTNGWQQFTFGAPMSLPGGYSTLARLWDDATNPTLTWQYDHWELWASTYSTNNHCGCNPTPSQSVVRASFIEYRTVTPQSGGSSLGAVQGMYSNIRCLPAAYDISRAYPFRLDNSSLLYSTSNDANCASGSGSAPGYLGIYVVLTSIQ